jgi:hypothetical protein
MLVLLSLGCIYFQDSLDDIVEDIEGLTNPLVVQAAFIGVAEPESEDIDLSDTEFADGSGLTAFLADAASADQMDEAPISGAEARIRVGNQAAVDLTEGETDGQYSATGPDGLSYVEGQEAVLTVVVGDSTSTLPVVLPPAASLDLPATGPLNQSITLDLAGQDFDRVLVVVLAMSSGEVTWSNKPEGIEDWYDFDDAADSFTIPAGAFADPDLYAIGVAGLDKADSEGFDNMNTALSGLQAGLMEFHPYLVQ